LTQADYRIKWNVKRRFMRILLLLTLPFVYTHAFALDIYEHLNNASGKKAHTYGWQELSCSSLTKPTPCVKGAKTASGVTFDPDVASFAFALPVTYRVKPMKVLLRLKGGVCKWIWLLDKKNMRMIEKAPWDLTKAAITLLGGKASSSWSGIVEVCKLPDFTSMLAQL
jgi:hypothetical protein